MMKSNDMPGEMISDERSEPSPREIFRYIIASGEMRYIERTERLIYLLDDPDEGWLVRGVIPGCGDSCDVDLSHLILEFIMSCEGLEKPTLQASVRVFTEKISSSVVDSIREAVSNGSEKDLLPLVLDCLFQSMGGAYTFHTEGDRISGTFDHCPLCVAISGSGIRRGGSFAHEVLLEIYQLAIRAINKAARVVVLTPFEVQEHDLSIEISYNVE